MAINYAFMKHIKKQGVESTFFPSRLKKYPSGLLTSIPAVDLSVIPSSLLMVKYKACSFLCFTFSYTINIATDNDLEISACCLILTYINL